MEAVRLYEQGLQALQRRDYVASARMLQEVLDRFPEERELHERVRLYLRVCERETSTRETVPSTPEERIYAATLALNAGSHDDALRHLEPLEREDPENDNVQYMLAVAQALRGETEPALTHLRRAIELNPENRALARQDPDLEALRSDESFRAMIDIFPGGGRRRPRGRTTR